MSILKHPESINSQNLQIWNNATFDDPGGLAVTESWPALHPISTNLLEPVDQDSSKENKSPASKNPLSLRPKFDPLTPFKKSADIDAEMEEIEKEIGRLSARLNLLCIRKAEQEARWGRIVPTKFMGPKQGPRKDLEMPDAKKVKESPARLRSRQRVIDPLKNFGASDLRKIEESPVSAKLQRRGVSLGPIEIQKSARLQKLKALEPPASHPPAPPLAFTPPVAEPPVSELLLAIAFHLRATLLHPTSGRIALSGEPLPPPGRFLPPSLQLQSSLFMKPEQPVIQH